MKDMIDQMQPIVIYLSLIKDTVVIYVSELEQKIITNLGSELVPTVVAVFSRVCNEREWWQKSIRGVTCRICPASLKHSFHSLMHSLANREHYRPL